MARLKRFEYSDPDEVVCYQSFKLRRALRFPGKNIPFYHDIWEVLEEKMGQPDSVSLCRIERLRWGSHYTKPFRVMGSQGIRLDSTLGSAGHTGKGYLFGTGLPFHPLDTNGLPFGLYEVPFQVQARYSETDSTYIRQLFRESREQYHEAVTILYHPVDLVEGQPSREDWLQFDVIAREEKHGIVTFSELLDWWRQRSHTEMAVTTGDQGAGFIVESSSDDLPLIIPLKNRDLVLESLLLDGINPKDQRMVTLQGETYVLVRIGSGTHNVFTRYGEP